MDKLTDNSPMPYGKYRGTAMANVPADYLLWLYDNNKCTPPVAKYIDDNMDVLDPRRAQLIAERKKKAESRMPFGSYKGVEISNVPAEYLMAMYEAGKCPKNVLAYIERNMDALQARAEKDRNNRALLRSMYK